MEKKLKSWQGWLLFGGSMVVVFVLGLCVSALMERRAEVASIFNNRKTVIKGIEARNELFKDDFPREYQTWTETAKTDFESEFNGNIAVDALEKRPEMVILWAGYAFSKDYSTPAGTCMLSKISPHHFVPVRPPVRTMDLSRLPVGPVRARMSLA